MSQFILDSQASPLGGLFSLKASAGEGAEVISGAGFKLALNEVESSAGLQRQPLGLAIAATALPLGKELPPELQVLAEGVLTSVELEQLNFAAQAMGLKLPQVLQDNFAVETAQQQTSLIQSQQLQMNTSKVPVAEAVSELNLAATLVDKPNIPNTQFEDKPEGHELIEETTLLVAEPTGENAEHLLADSRDIVSPVEDVDQDALIAGSEFSSQPLNQADLEEIIPTFVTQWLERDMVVVQPAESDNDAAAIEKTTLAALIDDNPDPTNWHAIKILVPDDQSPMVVGDIHARETSLLQLAKQLAQDTANSDEFISSLTARTRQPEALSQQLLRHFTAQMKSEMEQSTPMVKEAVGNELPATSRLAPEGLKFMQSLLDDAPVKDKAPAFSVEADSMVATSQSANQRTVAVDNAVQARIENVPVNPHRAEFQQQMEQRIQWMIARGMQSADIRIDPPELGTIHIRVAQHGDQTQVVFTSQHANVRDALENALPRLREMFEQQGLTLAHTDVRDQGGQSRSNGQESEQKEAAALNVSHQDDEDVVVTHRVGLVDTHV